jgi:hypothetical protein
MEGVEYQQYEHSVFTPDQFSPTVANVDHSQHSLQFFSNMAEKHPVSDDEPSMSSDPYESNTHSSMFTYDNDTLGFVCRTLP